MHCVHPKDVNGNAIPVLLTKIIKHETNENNLPDYPVSSTDNTNNNSADRKTIYP
jgi:hypothetical protein